MYLSKVKLKIILIHENKSFYFNHSSSPSYKTSPRRRVNKIILSIHPCNFDMFSAFVVTSILSDTLLADLCDDSDINTHVITVEPCDWSTSLSRKALISMAISFFLVPFFYLLILFFAHKHILRKLSTVEVLFSWVSFP